MAVLSALYPNLLDLTQRLDPDGQIAMIAEILNQTNDIIADVPWAQGNLDTGHRSTIRTGLPSVSWRKFYGSIAPSKSQTATITDACAMLRGVDEIDAELADMSGQPEVFRMTEAQAKLEAMAQAFVTALFFGDTTLNPEQFNGLYPRYSSLSANNGANIINAGGTGADNASIWLVGWGPMSVFGIYPKGSQAGLSGPTDGGRVWKEDADGAGGGYWIYRTYFKWDCGLVVKDWRWVVRVANIDRSALTADASSGADLPNLMAQAIERLPSEAGSPRLTFYMDRDVKFRWRQQMAYKLSDSTLSRDDLGGWAGDSFKGIPVKRCDALYADEAQVT